jgi:hypothetical protein
MFDRIQLNMSEWPLYEKNLQCRREALDGSRAERRLATVSSYEERIVGPPTWVREGMLTVSCKPILAYTISLTLFSLEPP